MDVSNNDWFKISNHSGFGQTGRDVLVLDGRIAGSSNYRRMTIQNANPVLDNHANANFIMLDIPNSDVQITGQTTIVEAQYLALRIQTQRMSASAAVTVNDASALGILGVPSPDANVTFGTSSAIRILNTTHGGTVTNQYGLYVTTQTGGTNNYGAYFGSKVDMGGNSIFNVNPLVIGNSVHPDRTNYSFQSVNVQDNYASSSPRTIHDFSTGYGGLVLITGQQNTGATNKFVDLILCGEAAGATPATINKFDAEGSPPTRTYLMAAAGVLTLTVGGGAGWDINVLVISSEAPL